LAKKKVYVCSRRVTIFETNYWRSQFRRKRTGAEYQMRREK
jgi:hypothetical protein